MTIECLAKLRELFGLKLIRTVITVADVKMMQTWSSNAGQWNWGN